MAWNSVHRESRSAEPEDTEADAQLAPRCGDTPQTAQQAGQDRAFEVDGHWRTDPAADASAARRISI
ncbi:MAG TPA: hypothetical protein VFO16_19050 [Pseudonocardiaceae bacterium]|nr:hypothetical protein [Pseudonocardiaceae bacterium]